MFWRLTFCLAGNSTVYSSSVPASYREAGRKVTNDFALILFRQHWARGRTPGRQKVRFTGPEERRFDVCCCNRSPGPICSRR